MTRKYSRQAQKFLDKCDMDTGRRLIQAIRDIPNGDIKKLRGHRTNTHRLRVGNIRVIYTVEENTVIIQKIDHRGDIYK
jgi:mRNA interferase RelE/StbE